MIETNRYSEPLFSKKYGKYHVFIRLEITDMVSEFTGWVDINYEFGVWWDI